MPYSDGFDSGCGAPRPAGLQKSDACQTLCIEGDTTCHYIELLGKVPTPKGAFLPQRTVAYMYVSVKPHS